MVEVAPAPRAQTSAVVDVGGCPADANSHLVQRALGHGPQQGRLVSEMPVGSHPRDACHLPHRPKGDAVRPARFEQLGRVHDDLIAGKGLRFAYDQELNSGDATLLRWSMVAPNEDVVGRGVDVVFRDEFGRVTRVYMFMGVS